MFAPGKPIQKVFHMGWLLSYLRKHYTTLEMLSRSEHSSLLQELVIYFCKKFYNIGPRPKKKKKQYFTRAYFQRC